MGANRKLVGICIGLAFALILGGAVFAAQQPSVDERAKIEADQKDTVNLQGGAPEGCTNLPTTAGPVPEWYAERCLRTVKHTVTATPEASRGPLILVEAAGNTVNTSTVAGIATLTPFGALVPTSATDFNGDLIRVPGDPQRVYQITVNGAVSRYNTAGANTVLAPIAPPAGSTWSDTATDPITGTVYAASIVCGTSSALNTIDPVAGTKAAVGPITNSTCLVALAADAAGNLWGIDIVSDSLISVNKVTGAGTVVGAIGFDSNFGQAMDCDPASGTCYFFAINNTLGTAELRSVNLVTGATTLVGNIGSTAPGGSPQVPGAVFETITDTCNVNADCQDGNLCNGTEQCVANVCQPGTPVNCDDSDFCTVDGCTPGTGACTHAPNPCDDGNPCTPDSCSNGACQHGAPSCQHICNTVLTSIPSSGTSTPYPSVITVAGLGTIASLASVEINGYTHTFPDDVDVLLAGPVAGQNAIIMSDVGGSLDVVGVNLVLTDSAAANLPDATQIVSGTFKPTNIGAGDPFAAPAPAPSGNVALSVFNNSNPNGNWSLYVVDDLGGDSGSIGNWCLNIAVSACSQDTDCNDNNPCTNDFCVNTNCQHTNNTNPCNDNNACTSNDTCTNGSCVGTAQNCDDGDPCTADGCDTVTGNCTHGPANCDDGDSCTLDGCSAPNGCTHVQHCAEVCNQNVTQILDAAPANPYPSQITVSGSSGTFSLAGVKLNNITHTFPDDIDMLLVGPGGQNAKIMSDAGGSADAVNVSIVLSDAAAAGIPDGGPLVAGTFKPTDINDGTDTFPAPAPAPSGGSALSVFNGTNPNGAWKLFIVDDAGVDTGTLGSWCLRLFTSCVANAECDDGDPCTIDTCSNTVCQHSGIGTPGEVSGDAFPNKTTFTWSATLAATSYDVVRGDAGSLPVGPGGGDEVCFGNIPTNSLTDGTSPLTDKAFFYLVRGKNACGPAGTYGQTSGGSPRITTTCP